MFIIIGVANQKNTKLSVVYMIDPTLPEELDEKAKLKLEVIQYLAEPCKKSEYTIRKREAAEKLGVSMRTVERLVKKWIEQGITAVVQSERADKQFPRIPEELVDFAIKTYRQGNQGGKRMSRMQVVVKVQIFAEERGLKAPCHQTVYNILSPIIRDKEKKQSVRSPGWKGAKLMLKTHDGGTLDVNYSNQVWQIDHTLVDILLVDSSGEIVGRPWLTTVVDSYSRSIMGIHIGFMAPSSQVVALALKHAIRPKTFPDDYELRLNWGSYGIPAHLFTDGGKDFRSNHAQQIAAQLGFAWHFRDRPSEGGIVERPFKTFNQQLWATLPGYTGSNTQERPAEAEKKACLTLEQAKKLLVQFIVHRYNAAIDARTGNQTRCQRWESGLLGVPDVLSERELDICLMRQARRQVMRGGYISFEGMTYRGEHLAAYQGETVALRYDPEDITSLYIYRYKAGKEVFLTRAVLVGFEGERLPLKQLESAKKKAQNMGKEVSQKLIKETLIQQEAEVTKGAKIMRERAKLAQSPVFVDAWKLPPSTNLEEESTLLPCESQTNLEVWDLTRMEEDYGF